MPGSYFKISNSDYKNRFKQTNKLGVGMVSRNDLVQFESAVNAALYLINPSKHNKNLKVMLKDMMTFEYDQI